VKNFGLVMFQDKPKCMENVVDGLVRFLERYQIIRQRFGLDNDSSIIHIRENYASQMLGASREAMHHWGNVQHRKHRG
jgi:hypothetical protein